MLDSCCACIASLPVVSAVFHARVDRNVGCGAALVRVSAATVLSQSCDSLVVRTEPSNAYLGLGPEVGGVVPGVQVRASVVYDGPQCVLRGVYT